MRRAAIFPSFLLLGLSCARAPAPGPQEPRCAALEVQDAEVFSQLSPRAPGSGALCLRYHRARAEVAWGLTPRVQAPVLTITKTALELREAGRLVGAWYGPCAGEPALRGEVSSEATHYMVRYLALRGDEAVQLQVGAHVQTVDLMFAIETMREFGHEIYLDPRPIVEVPACAAQEIREVELHSNPEPEVTPMDPGVLEAVVSPRLPMLQSCFRRTVRPLPCSSLVRSIELLVDPRGMVAQAAVADHTFGAPGVDGCVSAAVWDLVFPPPPRGRPVQAKLQFHNCEAATPAAPGPVFSPL